MRSMQESMKAGTFQSRKGKPWPGMSIFGQQPDARHCCPACGQHGQRGLKTSLHCKNAWPVWDKYEMGLAAKIACAGTVLHPPHFFTLGAAPPMVMPRCQMVHVLLITPPNVPEPTFSKHTCGQWPTHFS